MRRSTQVLLVLMGGGIIASAVVPLVMAPDCSQPTEQDASCSTGTSSRTSSSSSSYGHGGSTAAGIAAGAAAGATAATVARGGFGSTGAARASSGS
jgi:hypothetical protein